jgi:ubiquinone/menaquinone biosynthesis C-methylase UbiE
VSTGPSWIRSSYQYLRHSLFRLLVILELRWALLTGNRDWLLRRKFNRWARWGVGQGLEQCHLRITEKALQKMNLSPGNRILEMGCGEGWTCRLIARTAGETLRIVGMDIADEMVHRAQAKSGGFQNLSFVCASAEHIPCQANSFDKVLSIEAFYYIKNQENALKELLRVMIPQGELFLLIAFHKDNAESLRGADELGIPVHFRSAAEYEAMLIENGWTDVQTEIFQLQSQLDGKPDVHDRPLLITAKKPGPEVPAGPKA